MKADYTNYNSRAELIRSALAQAKDAEQYETKLDVAELNASVPIAPWHPTDALACPSLFLRCGLFRVAQPRAPRQYQIRYRYETQGSRGGYIDYTGEELRQSDGDVFAILLNAERETPGFAVVRPRQFANRLGWGDSNRAIQRLEASIARMSTASIEIYGQLRKGEASQPRRLELSLVAGYQKKSPRLWIVFLDGRLRHIDKLLFSWFKLDMLRALPVNGVLSSWLYKFFSTHREPHAIPIKKLRLYCGAASEANEFKRLLTAALENLTKVRFLESFVVDSENVTVVRASSSIEFEDEYV